MDFQRSLLNFRGTDNLVLFGHVQGENSTLEVYIYNDTEDVLYVHHDILLPSFPLALGIFINNVTFHLVYIRIEIVDVEGQVFETCGVGVVSVNFGRCV